MVWSFNVSNLFFFLISRIFFLIIVLNICSPYFGCLLLRTPIVCILKALSAGLILYCISLLA